MMLRRRAAMLGVAALLALFHAGAVCQERALLTIRAADSSLPVYLDSVLVGRTPVDSLPIATGSMILRVLSSREKAWTGPVLVETLMVRSGDHVLRDIAAAGIRRITTEPFGASVFAGDSLLGSTPLLLSPDFDGSMLRVSREGYEAAALPLTGDLHVVLVACEGAPSPYLFAEPARIDICVGLQRS